MCNSITDRQKGWFWEVCIHDKEIGIYSVEEYSDFPSCCVKEPICDLWERILVVITDDPKMARTSKKQGKIVLYIEEDGESVFGVDLVVLHREDLTFFDVVRTCERALGIPWEIAKGENWRLRESVPEDFLKLYEIAGRMDFEMTFGRKNRGYREEEQSFLEEIKAVYGFFSYGRWTLLIQEESGERVAGRIGFLYSAEEELPELSYYVDPSFQGKGIALEATKKALAYLFEEIGAEKIVVHIPKSNRRSAAFAEKLQFSVEDPDRQEYRYLSFETFAKEDFSCNSCSVRLQ